MRRYVYEAVLAPAEEDIEESGLVPVDRGDGVMVSDNRDMPKITITSAPEGLQLVDADGNIIVERAEGTSSSDASGNPSAVVLIPNESYKPDIDRIAARGFTDAHSSEAAYILEQVSYRHLSPYLSVSENHPGKHGPSLLLAHDVLTFDRRIQSVLFKYIGIFEAHMRAQYAHQMEWRHGEMALYDRSLFLRPGSYADSMNRLEGEVKRKCRKERSFKKLVDERGGKAPIWAASECMTLGTLSKLFANTADRDVTNSVAFQFGVSKRELSSWLRTITGARNLCAHFDPYIVRKQIPSTPLSIKGLDADANSPFYLAFLLQRLISSDFAIAFANLDYAGRMRSDIGAQIRAFEKHYPEVVRALGIPQNWQELMDDSTKGKIKRRISITVDLPASGECAPPAP